MKNDWSTIKKLIWLKIQMGASGILKTISGITPLTIADAVKGRFKSITQHGKVVQNGNPTTANPVDIVCNNGALKWDAVNSRIYADGTPEVLTVSATGVADQTASVENLLAVGPVADEQDIITGKVIRRTEAFVYDGTQTVKPTFMSTTGAATEGAIIVQPRGAEYAGDVVSFEAEEGENIDSLSVTLQPTQDLHGYDNPWPAGGGVNKLPAMVDGTYEGNGVKAVVKDGVATFSGTTTASGNAFIIPLTEEVTASDSFYYHCLNSEANASLAPSVENSNDTSYLISISLSPVNRISGNYTDRGGKTFNRIRFYIGSGVTISGTYAPMFCADNTARSYQPYENICPITGTEECEVVRCGKNLLNDDISVYSSATNYLYLLDVVPKLAVARMTFVDKDTSVDVSGCYIGFCSNDVETQTSPSEYRWCVNNGTLGSVLENISVRDVRLGSVFVYPKTQATFDKLFSRWNIQVELGVEATQYEPYQSTTLQIEWGAFGANQWDEEWESGGIYPTNGEPRTDANAIRSKNFIPVSAGTTYYGYIGASGVQLYIAYWNGDSYLSGGDRVDNRTFTVPTGATKAKIWTYGGTYSTYANDIAVNYPSTKTTYEPFTKTIYGGRVDAVRGEVVVTMKSVDMGSLTWTYTSSSGVPFFYSNLSDGIQADDFSGLCSQYKTVIGQTAFLASDKSIRMYGSSAYNFSRVGVRDTAYTDATAFKSAMHGVQLVYELAEPITLPLDPQTLTALAKNTVWSDAGSVDVLLTEELIESVTPQKLKTAEGSNTISATSEVGNVDLDVTYKTPV